MKFVQLILKKIIQIVATRCQILRLKCTKFDFGWDSAPDPTEGAYRAPPDPLAGFEGPTSKGGGGKKIGDYRGGEGGERRGQAFLVRLVIGQDRRSSAKKQKITSARSAI